MKSEANEHSTQNEFKPPKLPFTWLATTFIAPILVLIVQSIFHAESLSWAARLSVAFALLSIFLFVSCIRLMLNLYDISYSIQVSELKSASMIEESKKLAAETAERSAELKRYIFDLMQACKTATNDDPVPKGIAEQLSYQPTFQEQEL